MAAGFVLRRGSSTNRRSSAATTTVIRGASSGTATAESEQSGTGSMGTSSGFLALISAAVTPVVMISACATLIIGIGAKHAGLSDQARGIAAQYRDAPIDSTRRLTLRRELRIFLWRATLAWLAHCLLYLAAAIFAVTVLAALFALRRTALGRPTLILFVLGTATLIPALILEFLELLLAQRTLWWDTGDVLSEDSGAGTGSAAP